MPLLAHLSGRNQYAPKSNGPHNRIEFPLVKGRLAATDRRTSNIER